ncbi:hypothetical protein D3C85_1908550 [compost metagenome]
MRLYNHCERCEGTLSWRQIDGKYAEYFVMSVTLLGLMLQPAGAKEASCRHA